MKHKILRIVLGIFIFILAVEAFLFVIRFPIKIDEPHSYMSKADFIRMQYIEIYNNFFTLENEYYVIRRNSVMPWPTHYGKTIDRQKREGVKRVFIVGESLAYFYPIEILLNNLELFVPDKKFEVINAGAGGIDIYRIRFIVQEIVDNHEPDFLIILFGNNNFIFNPPFINRLPHKYRIFRTSRILNALSRILIPAFDSDHQTFADLNAKKIINHIDGRIPTVFVTLVNAGEAGWVPINENSILVDAASNDFIRTLPKQYYNVFVADFAKTVMSFNVHAVDILRTWCHLWDPTYDIVSRLVINEFFNKSIPIDKNYIEHVLEKNRIFKQYHN